MVMLQPASYERDRRADAEGPMSRETMACSFAAEGVVRADLDAS